MSKGYEFLKGEEKPFRCKECGRQFGSEGAYNLHAPCGPGYIKRMEIEKMKKERIKKQKEKAMNITVCPDCGGQNFRLLNPRYPAEDNAIKAGYVKVCKDCGEVL